MSKGLSKRLFILDLNGVLGCTLTNEQYLSRKKAFPQLKSNRTFEDEKHLILRPHFKSFLQCFFLSNRSKVEIGVWSSFNKQVTSQLSALYLKPYIRYMSFITFTTPTHPDPYVPSPIKRVSKILNFQNLPYIYEKYKEFNETNTVVVSTHPNVLREFSANDVIIPEYGISSDLLGDKQLLFLEKYLHGLLGLDQRVSEDVREQFRFISFDRFVQRWMRSQQKKEHDIYSDIVF